MTETTTKPKTRVRSKRKRVIYAKKPKTDCFSQAVAEKNILSNLILIKGLSIHDAAVACDLDTCKAYSRLFSKHPTDQQINRALEIYNKGLPLLTACVASGVSPEKFKAINKQRYANQYNPQRW
jgi:hypothetical protein